MTTVLDARRQEEEMVYGAVGHPLLPMRVLREGETLFEGAGIELSENVVYFRTSRWEALRAGDRLRLDVSFPVAGSGGGPAVRTSRFAIVSRVDAQTLSEAVGRSARSRSVVLVMEEEPVRGAPD